MAWGDCLKGAHEAAPVGAEIAPYPYISGLGLLTRMTRLGALTGPEITALGFRNRASIDVQFATQELRAPARSLLTAAGLAATCVAEFWPMECWSPARLGRLLNSRRPVRHCLECAAHGYHATLFQLPSVYRCPWHQAPLMDHCPSCRRTFWSRFDRLGKLGRCECGFDLFRPSVASVDMWEFPTEAADEWSTQYLGWAGTERENRCIAADKDAPWVTAGVAVLAQPPEQLQPAPVVKGTVVEVFAGKGDDPSPGFFWGWLLVGGERPLTYAPLPNELHPQLATATRHAVDAFSASASTPLELVTLQGFDRDRTLRENVANRPECFVAPHGLSVEGTTWLNLSAVDRSAIQGCRAALEGAATCLAFDLPAVDRSVQAAKSAALDAVPGRRHLANALAAIVLRGYRQGLEAILRTLMGLGAPPASTYWVSPVVELNRQDGGLAAVRICWVITDPPPVQRTVDVHKYPPSRKAKRRRMAGKQREVPSRGDARKLGADSFRLR